MGVVRFLSVLRVTVTPGSSRPLIGSTVTWPPPSAIPTSKLSVILQPTTTKQKDFYSSLKKKKKRSTWQIYPGAFHVSMLYSVYKSKKKHFSLQNVVAPVIQTFPKLQIQYYTGYTLQSIGRDSNTKPKTTRFQFKLSSLVWQQYGNNAFIYFEFPL